jgi:hypothetical protein
VRTKNSAAAIIAAEKTFRSRTFSTPTRVYINYSPHSLQLGLACPQERIVCDWFDDALLSYALKSVVTEVEQREGVSLESVAALVGEQY